MTTPAFDIFQVQDRGVLWVGSAATVEEAKEHVRRIVTPAPVKYLLLNQKTGNKIVIELDGVDGTVLLSENQEQSDAR
jgi:hypothetical protein